ncbi:hypothetical protein AB6A40_008138 [Gnathostoma spinigerum]|uniref:Cytochrome c biogenesis protein n=1 Tax=Gnathostoma spinigerum TaxID=75299 RepID=A0ABD6ETC9_9BILA
MFIRRLQNPVTSSPTTYEPRGSIIIHLRTAEPGYFFTNYLRTSRNNHIQNPITSPTTWETGGSIIFIHGLQNPVTFPQNPITSSTTTYEARGSIIFIRGLQNPVTFSPIHETLQRLFSERLFLIAIVEVIIITFCSICRIHLRFRL